MIERLEALQRAAADFFDENPKLCYPIEPDGITGTSIGLGNEGVGIIVHINSSKEIYDLVPASFREFKIYKSFERNQDERKSFYI